MAVCHWQFGVSTVPVRLGSVGSMLALASNNIAFTADEVQVDLNGFSLYLHTRAVGQK